jgi:prevent-host-death family protein
MYISYKIYNMQFYYFLYNRFLVRRLDATEARKKFSDVLNWVCFGRETVVVTRHGRDIAAVVPMDKADAPDDVESRKPASSVGVASKGRKHG